MLRSDHYCKIKRVYVVVVVVSFFIVMGNPFDSDEPHHDDISSPAMLLDERDTPTNVQADERDIGIYGEKESERERERVRMNVYDCGEGLDGVFQNRFLANVARDAVDVMPSNILWTGARSMSVE